MVSYFFYNMSDQEFLVLLMFLSLAPMIFFLLMLQNTFKEISAESRKMQPGMVWLIFIPLFGLVLQFIIVSRLADSLRDEFTKKNIRVDEARPGVTIGLCFCILSCCGILLYLGILPIYGLLSSIRVLPLIGALACWIIYWVKINGFKQKLSQNNKKLSQNTSAEF